jgi:hypothetical protein
MHFCVGPDSGLYGQQLQRNLERGSLVSSFQQAGRPRHADLTEAHALSKSFHADVYQCKTTVAPLYSHLDHFVKVE